MKRKILILLVLILTIFCLVSCEEINTIKPGDDPIVDNGDTDPSGDKDPEPDPEPEPVVEEKDNRYRTYYQLLVYSFADGNGDGIGDFKGIIDKLDYLDNLGIEGIWLSPVNKASSYHSYDVTDYYAINPKYEVTVDGVNYNLEKLLEECHKRDIYVLMDLVLNHTSYNHTWKKDHSNWYTSKDNKFGFPELDYDKQEVREAVKQVGYYWLDKGVDGYRLDAAMWIYNSGSDQHTKNYSFWTEWCNAMREHKEGCYIIAEVLDSNSNLAYSYAQGGFDSTFEFNAISALIQNVKGTSKNYVTAVSSGISNAEQYNPDYILARTLSNHDIGRFTDKSSYGTVSEEWQINLANVINALTPGNTFIYYGDELGLKGTCKQGYEDMAYRTPMPFETEMTNSVKYFQGFHGDGKTTSTTFSGKSPEADMNDSNSIYNKLKAALELKNNNKIFQKGIIESIDDLDSRLNGYSLYLNGKTIYVVFSTRDVQVTYNFSGEVLLNSTALRTEGSIILKQGDYIVIEVK